MRDSLCSPSSCGVVVVIPGLTLWKPEVRGHRADNVDPNQVSNVEADAYVAVFIFSASAIKS